MRFKKLIEWCEENEYGLQAAMPLLLMVFFLVGMILIIIFKLIKVL